MQILVSKDQPENPPDDTNQCLPAVDVPPLSMDSDLALFKQYFPRWMWNTDHLRFGWTTAFVLPDSCKLPAQLTHANWVAITGKLCSLRWALGDNLNTSIMELTFVLRASGLNLEGIPDTPKAYATLVRKAINVVAKKSFSPIVPGTLKTTVYSNGKSHPSGFLAGALVLPHQQAMRALACSFVHHHLRQVLSEWSFSFGDFF